MDHEELLSELRAIRLRLDQLAATLISEQAEAELLPKWSCGHRHRSRKEAQECLNLTTLAASVALPT